MFPFSFISGGSASFTSEYQAILDEATALGYTLPSAGQQAKQNQLIIDLKTAGVWDKLDVFYVYANDSGQNFSTLNWKNPNVFQGSLINSPTFTTNQGFAGNGTTSYISHNYNPATQGAQYQLNSASIYLHILTAGTGLGVVGCDSSYDNVILSLTDTSWCRMNSSNSYATPAVNMVASNNTFLGVNRISSSQITMYKNKTASTRNQASTSIPSSSLESLKSFAFYGAHLHTMYAAGSSLASVNDSFQDAYSSYLSSL